MRLVPVIAVLGLILSGCAVSGLSRDVDAPLIQGTESSAEPVSGIVGGGLIMRTGVPDMTKRERATAAGAEYQALETAPADQAVEWRDEKSGHHGTVIAAQPYRVGSQDCRAYSQTVNARGSEYSARGTACRNADGSWTLLN